MSILQKMGITILLLLALLVVGMTNESAFSLIPVPTTVIQQYVPPEPTLTRQEYIATKFSSWDGSHTSVVAYVKAQMHNPASFRHVRTSYQDYDDRLMITMVYEGTNAFNARVQEKVVCEVEVRTGIVHRCVSQ